MIGLREADGVKADEANAWLIKLQRIEARSQAYPQEVFNNIFHIIGIDMLRTLYFEMPSDKAIGVDRVSKNDYGLNLDENLTLLVTRIKRGTYKPKPARLVEIPKEDGSTRPLAISCFEDKLVQEAVNKILNKIYEPLFLDSSYGFRPNRSPHLALQRLSEESFKLKEGAIVEIDLRKCFNMIPHDHLHTFLEEKISDRRFLRLVNALVKTPVHTKEGLLPSDLGCPQGSIISPILANVYLHHVIDKWFEAINVSHLKGQGKAIRFADDAVFVFHSKTEAEKFAKALPKRLAKYGLELNEAKSGILPAGSFLIQKMIHSGVKPPTFKFLGFVCYWGLSKSGKFYRLKFKSRSDRLQKKINGLKKHLKENRNTPDTGKFLDNIKRVVVGWMNYHSISDNIHQVRLFDNLTRRCLFEWFKRRSQRSKMTFEKLSKTLNERRYPVCKIRVQMYPTPASK